MQQALHIAMLEDDRDDRYLTKEVLAELPFNIQIQFFGSSTGFCNNLLKQKPQLVLLDFNATPENGLQVLRQIKATAELQSIPVVILGDSEALHVKEACYREGAATYVVKPRTMQETKQKITSFFTYWVQVAKL